MFKKMMAALLVATMLMGMGVTAFANEMPSQAVVLRFEIGNPAYTRDGVERQSIDGVAPFADPGSDRMMLPLRTVAEALGANVDWIEATRTILISRDGVTVSIPVDEPLPGGVGMPVIVDGRTFVPIDYVAQELGAEVRQGTDAQAVYVYDAPQAPVVPEPVEYEEAAEVEIVEAVEEYEEIEAPYIESITAYELLTRSSEALTEAGSIFMTSIANMTMVLDGETMDLVMISETAQVIRSETDIDMRMESITTVESALLPEAMVAPSVVYFRDGMFYFDMMGIQGKMSMPLEEIIEQAGFIEFPEDAIISQVISEGDAGTELTFTVSGSGMESAMESMTSGMLGMLDIDEMSINIGDSHVAALIDEDGMMRSMVVYMTMSMELEGIMVSMSMDMLIEVVQVGGVTIDFPAHLDTFEEI